MALIKCPECGKEQSSFAKVCANCSFPLEEYALNPEGFAWNEPKGEEPLDDEKTETQKDLHGDGQKISEENQNETESVSEESKEGDTVYTKETENASYFKDSYKQYSPDIEQTAEKFFMNMGKVHKLIDWIIAVGIIVFSLLPLIGGSPICGLLWLISGIMILPVNSILLKWDSFLKGRNVWLRPVIIIVMNFVGFFVI